MKQFFPPFWEVLETLAKALVSLFIIYTFIAQPFIVQGASMEPNFSDDDYVLIDMITYRFGEPHRGEVVVFKNPRNEKEFHIKRIIGLPGEEITINGGEVKVNGALLRENYLLAEHGLAGERVFDLGNDEYFVMGDNRSESLDSRSLGPLKKHKITGTVRLRFWPPVKIQIFMEAPTRNYS